MARTVSAAEIAALRDAAGALADDPDAALPRPVVAAACRTACALLAARHPGGTVELRVPPFAAVQLGIGERGRHTRGTPPNVVQTDPATLLRLASGSLAWPDALASRAIRASGIYSDLGPLWPLPELA